MREAIRVGYGVWSLVVVNATALVLLAFSFAALRSLAGRRAMKTPVASGTLRVRLLSDPCLWCWEIADPHRNDALLYGSWANEWSAYESREEALRAGQARLAELQFSGAGLSRGERREERRHGRGSAGVSRRTGVNAAVTVLLIGALAATAAPASATERVGEVFRRVRGAVVTIRTTERGVDGPSTAGLGSGVLVSADGKVITAAHVVQVADEVIVEFGGGLRVASRVVASETEADVALLQLDSVPVGVEPAVIGDSDRIEVGDPIFVVGAPYGMSHTLTVGHVSARREPGMVHGSLGLADFFQTDAAINKGNSGGPLFSMAGEVIGIVSNLVSRSGGSEGLGFAVTSNLARRLLLERPTLWSGISGKVLAGDLANALNVPAPGGILIERVARGSPAAAAGLRGGFIEAVIGDRSLILGGDVLLTVDGIPAVTLEGHQQIQDRLSQLGEGAVVAIEVLRAGRKITVERSISSSVVGGQR